MLKAEDVSSQELEYFSFLYTLDLSETIFQQKQKGNDQVNYTSKEINTIIQNETKIEDFLWYSNPVNMEFDQYQSCKQIQQKNLLNHTHFASQVDQIANEEEQKSEHDKYSSKFTKKYRKNICGYISKYIIKKILSCQYQLKLSKICKKYKCDLKKFKAFYQSKKQKLFGPNDLICFFGSEQQSEEQICIRKIFVMLFQKILRKKYLGLALAQGKMTNLQAYIQYKNKYLLYFSELFRF